VPRFSTAFGWLVSEAIEIRAFLTDCRCRAREDGTIPKTDGLTFRDDGLYMQRGELDIMVIEKPGDSRKSKILAREEIKTGGRDDPGDAVSQLTEQNELFARGARGQATVRLEVGGKDITGRIDLGSDALASKTTRGPAEKKYNQSLGVTSSDLERLCKDLIDSSIVAGERQ
jgi:hypothetical protein